MISIPDLWELPFSPFQLISIALSFLWAFDKWWDSQFLTALKLGFTEQTKALVVQVDFIFRASSGSDARLGEKSESIIVLSAPYIHPFNSSEFLWKEKKNMFHSRLKSQSIFVLADTAFFFFLLFHFLFKACDLYLRQKEKTISLLAKRCTFKEQANEERYRSAVSCYNLHHTIKDITGPGCSLKHYLS